MKWHFQVMRNEDGEYHIHEYYKFPDGEKGWTENPIPATGKSYESLIEELEAMLKDAKANGVLDHATGNIIEE
jgi:hypothetical protein